MGGNCPLTEADKTVVKHGVTIVGETNLAALVGGRRVGALCAQRARLPQADRHQGRRASSIDLEDDIVAACLMAQDGAGQRKK